MGGSDFAVMSEPLDGAAPTKQGDFCKDYAPWYCGGYGYCTAAGSYPGDCDIDFGDTGEFLLTRNQRSLWCFRTFKEGSDTPYELDACFGLSWTLQTADKIEVTIDAASFCGGDTTCFNIDADAKCYFRIRDPDGLSLTLTLAMDFAEHDDPDEAYCWMYIYKWNGLHFVRDDALTLSVAANDTPDPEYCASYEKSDQYTHEFPPGLYRLQLTFRKWSASQNHPTLVESFTITGWAQ